MYNLPSKEWWLDCGGWIGAVWLGIYPEARGDETGEAAAAAKLDDASVALPKLRRLRDQHPG
jgi:hypothetical protein